MKLNEEDKAWSCQMAERERITPNRWREARGHFHRCVRRAHNLHRGHVRISAVRLRRENSNGKVKRQAPLVTVRPVSSSPRSVTYRFAWAPGGPTWWGCGRTCCSGRSSCCWSGPRTRPCPWTAPRGPGPLQGRGICAWERRGRIAVFKVCEREGEVQSLIALW